MCYMHLCKLCMHVEFPCLWLHISLLTVISMQRNLYTTIKTCTKVLETNFTKSCRHLLATTCQQTITGYWFIDIAWGNCN